MVDIGQGISLKRKFTTLFVVILFSTFLTIGGVQVYINSQQQDATVINTAGQQRQLLQEMTTELYRIESGESDRRAALRATVGQYNRTLTAFITGNETMAIPAAPPAVQHELRALRTEWEPFRANLTAIATSPTSSVGLQQTIDSAQANSDTILEATDDVVTQYERTAAEKIAQLQTFLLATAALNLAVLVIGWRLVTRNIVSPVRRLATDARQIADGDLEHEVTAFDNGDEIGDVGQAVQAMKAQLTEMLQARTEQTEALRASKQELTAKNERLDKFAHVVSHDLRNPLTIAMGRLELARKRGDDEHFDRVESALARIERIIDDVLSLAREGRDIGVTEPVNLRDISEASWAVVADDFDAASLDIAADGLGTIEADYDRLRQLLENLFRNAVEHGSTSTGLQARQNAVEHGSTSPDSRTRQDAVEPCSTSPDSRTRQDATERGGEGVRVRVGGLDNGFYVEDNGPGIPADSRQRVFEDGYSTSENGTGLGLSIVAQIVAAHGWRIAITDGTGGGARFEITVGDR